MDFQEELKPCPCCGGESHLHYLAVSWVKIECTQCGLQSSPTVFNLEGDEEKFIKKWNLRPESKPIGVDEYEQLYKLFVDAGIDALTSNHVLSSVILLLRNFNSSLPAQPDIAQLKAEIEKLKEQKAKVYAWLDTSNFKVNKYSAELTRKNEQIKRLKEMLSKIQYSDIDYTYDEENMCPICTGKPDIGHFDGCELNALLAEIRED